MSAESRDWVELKDISDKNAPPSTREPQPPKGRSKGEQKEKEKKNKGPKVMPRTSSRIMSTKEILSNHNSRLDLMVQEEEKERMHMDLLQHGEIYIAGCHWRRWLIFSLVFVAMAALIVAWVMLNTNEDGSSTTTFENRFESVLIVSDTSVVLESNMSASNEWKIDDGNVSSQVGGEFLVRVNLTNHYANPKVLYLEQTPMATLCATPPTPLITTNWLGHNAMVDYEGLIVERDPGTGQTVTIQAGETLSAEIDLGPSMIFLADSGVVTFDLRFEIPFRGVQSSIVELSEQATNAVDLSLSQVGRRLRHVRRATHARRKMTAGAGTVSLTTSSDAYAGVPFWDCGPTPSPTPGCYSGRWTKPWNAKSYTVASECSSDQQAELEAAEALKDQFCANLLYCMEKKTAACNDVVNKWFGCSGDTCTDDSQWDTMRTGWVRICSATNYYYECAADENFCEITFTSQSSCSSDADCGYVDGSYQAITGGTCSGGVCDYASAVQNHIPEPVRDAFVTQCNTFGCGYSATVAWVWNGEPCASCTRRMNLCRIGFWVQKNVQDSNWRSKASVIIHELAHFRDVQNTDDETYSTSVQLAKAAEVAASGSTSDDWYYITNSANWDNLSDDYVPDGGTPQAWNTFDDGAPSPAPCTVSEISSSAATWSGSGCFNGATVEDSTTCNLVAKYGYTCTSPGLCTNGTWTQTAFCTANVCDLIQTTASGTAAGGTCAEENAFTQPICTFFCESGYAISGTNPIACDTDGNWPSHPTCVVAPTPTPISNPCIAPTVAGGSWSGTGCNNGASVPHDTSCSLAASSGYTCTSPGLCSNGTWADNGSCVENTCDAVNASAGGGTAGANCPARGASTVSWCTFSCDTGFAVDGVNPIGCNPNGTWDVYPNCVASNSTSNPCTLPTIGSAAATWSGSSECADGAQITHGESCALDANFGYTCTSPGLCSNGAFVSLASCVQNMCPAININATGTAAGANCEGGGASNSPMCTFSCADGYKISEASTNPIACSSAGTWPGEIPVCVNASSVEDDDATSQIFGVDSNTFFVLAVATGVLASVVLCCCLSYCFCWTDDVSENCTSQPVTLRRSLSQDFINMLPPRHQGIRPVRRMSKRPPSGPPVWTKRARVPPGVPMTVRPKCTARVSYRYEANAMDELNLLEGRIVRVLVVHNDGWCYGMDMKSRKKGMFPMNFVKALN